MVQSFHSSIQMFFAIQTNAIFSSLKLCWELSNRKIVVKFLTIYSSIKL